MSELQSIETGGEGMSDNTIEFEARGEVFEDTDGVYVRLDNVRNNRSFPLWGWPADFRVTLTRIEPERARYPMGADQPAQVDCRRADCAYYVGAGICSNVSPAITLAEDGAGRCWSYKQRKGALPPCPYCGSHDVRLDNENGYIVLCSTPGCQAYDINPFSHRKDAIAAWNRRA